MFFLMNLMLTMHRLLKKISNKMTKVVTGSKRVNNECQLHCPCEGQML